MPKKLKSVSEDSGAFVQFRRKQTSRGVRFKRVESSPPPVARTPVGTPSGGGLRTPGSVRGLGLQPLPDIPEDEVVEHPVFARRRRDPLRDWVQLKDIYLAALYRAEAPRVHKGSNGELFCMICKKQPGQWRCRLCWGNILTCTACVLSTHQTQPFHPLDELTASGALKQSSLSKVGMKLHLGPRGKQCPCHSTEIHQSGFNEESQESEPEFEQDDEDAPPLPDPRPSRQTRMGRGEMVIIHTTGVHSIPVLFCRCPGSDTPLAQLLDAGLCPSTQLRVNTCFTFDVLDEFLLENLECKTPASSFYSRIQRLTDPVFPKSVPDHHQSLLRVAREWSNLRDLMRNGFGYAGRVTPGAGELALFCPACPQPDVNLPANWRTDVEDRWKYSRIINLDGNFSAEHMRMRRPENDVQLADGSAFMVTSGPYAEHLAATRESRERSSCNNHKAVNTANMDRHKLDVTGIGAACCARHGCFFPHSVCDFQKGERQVNMDYALSNAMNYRSEGLDRTILLYDINCQYSVHLQTRFIASPSLKMPRNMTIMPGIGLFHVHGHQQKCFMRYSPSNIEGAGLVDGEILETLWSQLNRVAGSTRSMSNSHRKEVLDRHMNDSNWKKIIGMAESLKRKYTAVVPQLQMQEEIYADVVDGLSPELIQRWSAALERAQGRRVGNVAEMDIFDVQQDRAPSRMDIQIGLTTKEGRAGHLAGTAAWLNEGLKIQENQLSLAAKVRKLGANITRDQKLELAQQRARLRVRIEKFERRRADYYGQPLLDNLDLLDTIPRYAQIHRDVWDGPEEEANPFLTADNEAQVEVDAPERFNICLPSSLGPEHCRTLQAQGLMTTELELRIGQANDTLEQIRIIVGQKSFVYRERVRPATSQQTRTRAQAALMSTEASLQEAARLYMSTRNAMVVLGASEEQLNKYKVLDRTHLAVNTAVAEPNARGQRGAQMAWYFSVNNRHAEGTQNWMEELYRVNWFRTRSRLDRLREEECLLRHEMIWTENYFRFMAQQWMSRRESAMEIHGSSGVVGLDGKSAYADRWAVTYKKLAEQVKKVYVSLISGPAGSHA